MNRRFLIALAASALAISACSVVSDPAVLVFHNRSDVPIALYPDVVVEPCSTMELDRAEVDEGKARLDEAWASGEDFDAWVPAGALQYKTGAPGRLISATEPITIVVSALALRIEEQRVAPAELPDCGGAPVGIE